MQCACVNARTLRHKLQSRNPHVQFQVPPHPNSPAAEPLRFATHHEVQEGGYELPASAEVHRHVFLETVRKVASIRTMRSHHVNVKPQSIKLARHQTKRRHSTSEMQSPSRLDRNEAQRRQCGGSAVKQLWKPPSAAPYHPHSPAFFG